MEIEFANGEERQRMRILGDGLSCYHPPQGLKMVELILEQMGKDKVDGKIVRKLTLGDGRTLSDFDAGYKTDQGETRYSDKGSEEKAGERKTKMVRGINRV